MCSPENILNYALILVITTYQWSNSTTVFVLCSISACHILSKTWSQTWSLTIAYPLEFSHIVKSTEPPVVIASIKRIIRPAKNAAAISKGCSPPPRNWLMCRNYEKLCSLNNWITVATVCSN